MQKKSLRKNELPSFNTTFYFLNQLIERNREEVFVYVAHGIVTVRNESISINRDSPRRHPAGGKLGADSKDTLRILKLTSVD